MNEFYQAKFNELFLEFNRYLLMHPDFGEKFPSEAEVILLGDLQDGLVMTVIQIIMHQEVLAEIVMLED